jgi:hydrogenase/urease accessory protein HupE
MKRVLIVLALWLTVSSSFAHGLRLAYLDLREESPGEFSVVWKTQIVAGALTVLEPRFSGQIQITEPPVSRETANAVVQTWRLRAIEPLRGQTLHIAGLATAMDDALVRLEFANGTTWVKRLTAAEPSAMIPLAQSGWSVAWEFLQLGIEHILLGIDHLLFVLALLIITQGTLRLVKTVTAFTVAHSITLGLATLGLVHVPSKPVEAVIALSIVFVAIEIIHAQRGRIGLTANAPWVVAFTFGLLHGFGFAGALSELGVPSGHVPTALLFFNVGVELGQLAFITVVLIFMKITLSLRSALPHWTELVPPYVIGSVAMFWVLQRTATF